MKQLPKKYLKKPSLLLQLALSDLKKVEQDENYDVNMTRWHIYDDLTNKCNVCLAGSILAKTIKLFHRTNYDDYLYNSSLERKFKWLYALDAFRQGAIAYGLYILGKPVRYTGPYYIDVTPYEIDKIKFKKGMRRIVSILKKNGL